MVILTDGDQNKTMKKKKKTFNQRDTEIQNTTGPHNQQHLLQENDPIALQAITLNRYVP